MANSRIYFKSEAGGTTTLSRDTSSNSGNLVLPASGNVASVDTAVTDNAIARFDSTTGKLQNSGVTIDDNNQLILGSADISSVWTNGSLGFHNTVGTTIRGKAGSVFDLSLYNAGGTSAILSHTPAGVVALNGGKLNIDSAGNVGIGTGSPIAELHIKGTITTTYSRLKLSNSTSGDGSADGFDMVSTGLDAYLINRENGGNLILSTNNAEKMRIDTSGNVLVTSSGGGLGYGTGAGGTVTQLTSKSTAVTLNKPTGTITMSNSALAAGASIQFAVYNSLVSNNDTIVINQNNFALNTTYYRFEASASSNGVFSVRVTNITGTSLSDAIPINFTILKGANS